MQPQIWQQFEAITLDLIARGVQRYSADAVLHQVRFDGRQKIRNAFSAFYARKFREHHPQHARIFRFYASHADPLPYEKPRQGDLFADR